ncbi:hypothetical protein JCM11491_006075 [Sporobolomyces phaffii]
MSAELTPTSSAPFSQQTPPSAVDSAVNTSSGLTERKIDRLSSLPNELLDRIFDLAHTLDHPSTGALSKHLLPFHISGLYRRIHLEKLANFVQLVDKVSREPEYGGRIRSLRIEQSDADSMIMETVSWGDVAAFFRSLSRLEELDLGEDELHLLRDVVEELPARTPSRPISGTIMPSLVTLRAREEFLFWWFRAVPSLVRLEYVEFNDVPYDAIDSEDYAIDSEGYVELPKLEFLSFTGLHAGHPGIALYCSICPQLRHLRLCVEDDYAEYGLLLPLLPSILVSLELESDSQYLPDPCDDLLPRFARLERLSLDKGNFTPQLPSYLASLSHLKELRLGEGQFSIDQFLQLVSGPTRLPSFHKLTLDYQKRLKIGYRIEVDDDGSIGGRWVPGEGRLAAGDWILPAFDFDGKFSDGFTPRRIRDLIQVVCRQGVEVDGNISHALEVADAYLLEVANLAVYRSFRDGDLRHIVAVRERGKILCGRLPSLDLDALDPENLELVKTNLPDEGWFQLSLRNKGSE